MKLILDRKPLFDAVQTVIGATSPKSPIPALANIHFRSDGTVIQLTANDLEVLLTTHFTADEHEPFEALWPAKRLSDILKALPESSMIGLAQKDSDFHLTVGKSRFKLVGGDPQDYPSGQEEQEHLFSVELPQAELLEQLETVEHAMAKDDVRYYLNGMCLQFGAHLTAVATDGHRLAAMPGATVLGREETHELILPRKAVNELKKRLGEGTCRIDVTNRGIKVDFGTTALDSRLIDGRFPEWQRVIPNQPDTEVEVDVEAMIAALRRVCLIVPQGSGVRLTLDLVEANPRFWMNGENFDEDVQEELEDFTSTGPALSKGFNPRYLLDVFEALGTPRATLGLSGGTIEGPMRIKAENHDGVFVVMGMRL
jgi:DNA polymerase-3 subunit beta